MPIYQLPADQEFRMATGGMGLEGVAELPAVLFGSESRDRMISQGMHVERETWRMSSGEVALYVIPRGETVVLSDIVALPTGGIQLVEQPVLDYGIGEVVPISTVTDANKEWADAQLLAAALAAGGEAGDFILLPDGTIIPAPPRADTESSPSGGEAEAPTTIPPESVSEEALPPDGCETIDILNFGPNGEFIGTSQEHFNGWEWVPI